MTEDEEKFTFPAGKSGIKVALVEVVGGTKVGLFFTLNGQTIHGMPMAPPLARSLAMALLEAAGRIESGKDLVKQ